MAKIDLRDGNAHVIDKAHVFDYARIYGDNTWIFDDSEVGDCTEVCNETVHNYPDDDF